MNDHSEANNHKQGPTLSLQFARLKFSTLTTDQIYDFDLSATFSFQVSLQCSKLLSRIAYLNISTVRPLTFSPKICDGLHLCPAGLRALPINRRNCWCFPCTIESVAPLFPVVTAPSNAYTSSMYPTAAQQTNNVGCAYLLNGFSLRSTGYSFLDTTDTQPYYTVIHLLYAVRISGKHCFRTGDFLGFCTFGYRLVQQATKWTENIHQQLNTACMTLLCPSIAVFRIHPAVYIYTCRYTTDSLTSKPTRVSKFCYGSVTNLLAQSGPYLRRGKRRPFPKANEANLPRGPRGWKSAIFFRPPALGSSGKARSGDKDAEPAGSVHSC